MSLNIIRRRNLKADKRKESKMIKNIIVMTGYIIRYKIVD